VFADESTPLLVNIHRGFSRVLTDTMEHKTRSKPPAEITITYKRSDFTATDELLAEALKEVFTAAEAAYLNEITHS